MSNINLSSYPNQTNTAPNANIARILLDMTIAFAPLMTLGVIAEWIGDGTTLGAILINVAYVLSLIFATIMLRSRGSGWRQIGLARPKSWPKTLFLSLGAMVAGFVAIILASILLQALLQLLPVQETGVADRSNYDPLVGNLPLLFVYLTAAWTIIPFGEEMIFRAFVINSLASLFPNGKAKWTLALLGSALLFGLVHYSWGLGGVVQTTVMGLTLGFIYLRTGRNLWVTIIAHGLMNTLVFVLTFLGMSV
jgi:membrane protease YdiL (CAAX protease family)